MKFDPMTGQPIYGNVDTTPLPTKKGMGKGAKIAIAAVAAIAVIGTTVGVSAKNGAFLSNEAKVGHAAANTFKEQPQIMEDVNVIDIPRSSFSPIRICLPASAQRLRAMIWRSCS